MEEHPSELDDPGVRLRVSISVIIIGIILIIFGLVSFLSVVEYEFFALPDMA